METEFNSGWWSQQCASSSELYYHTATEHGSKKHKCGECGKEFSDNNELIVHARVHTTGERPYKCTVADCGMKFQQLYRLNDHIKSKHSDERPLECNFPGCQYSCKRRRDWVQHMKRKHNDDRPFACPQEGCNFRAKLKESIPAHVKSIHSTTESFLCSECDYKATQKEDLNSHMHHCHSPRVDDPKCSHSECAEFLICLYDLDGLQSDEKEGSSMQYEQSGCEQTFATTNTLNESNRNANLEQSLVGPILNGTIDTRPILSKDSASSCSPDMGPRGDGSGKLDLFKRHMQSHTAKQDDLKSSSPPPVLTLNDLDGVLINWEKDCSSHMDQQLERDVVSTVRGTAKPFACSKCDYKTTRENDAMSHMRDCLSARGDFRCSHPNCNRSFKTPRDLQSHFSNRHEERIFHCDHPDCCKSFGTRKVLNVHKKRFHSKKTNTDKPFDCPNECGKKFRDNHDLIVHMRVHTGERPYKCTVTDCGMKFKDPSTRNIHIQRKHSDERPFACDFPCCKFTCKTTQNLYKHKKKHSVNRPFSCPKEGCDFRAKREKSIPAHVKRFHSTTESLVCSECDYKATRIDHFQRHMRRHTASKDDLKSTKLSPAFYFNDLDNVLGNWEKDCNAHAKPQLSFHLTTGQRPAGTFACAECDYKTTRGGDALNHMYNCPSARKDFKCSHPKCNRSFKTRNRLRSHFNNRHKERIFQCDHPGCGKKFATAERLNLHKRKFHSEKRDACPRTTSSLPQFLNRDDLDGLFGNEDQEEERMETDHLSCDPSSANADALHAWPSANQNEGNIDWTEQTGNLEHHPTTVNSTAETFASSKCDYQTSQNEDLNSHMHRCHSTRVDDPKCRHSECAGFPICLYDLDGLQNDEKEESSMQCKQSGCEQTFANTNTLNESNRNANLEESLVGPILNGSSSTSTAQDFQTLEADNQENIEPNTIHTSASFSKDSGFDFSADMRPRGDGNAEESADVGSNWFDFLLSSVELINQ